MKTDSHLVYANSLGLCDKSYKYPAYREFVIFKAFCDIFN